MKKLLLALLVLIGLQTQAQFTCDSITYWTDQGQGLFIGLDTTNIAQFNLDSIEVWWGVCTYPNGTCYTGQGITDYFPQITTTDTIKVTYDVYLYDGTVINGVPVLMMCSIEDWLVFNQNSFSWVLLNTLPTSINELTFNRVNDNKIYDMLGKELSEIPTGQMYIQNGKLYIRNK